MEPGHVAVVVVLCSSCALALWLYAGFTGAEGAAWKRKLIHFSLHLFLYTLYLANRMLLINHLL